MSGIGARGKRVVRRLFGPSRSGVIEKKLQRLRYPIRWGTFASGVPLDRRFGATRGLPIDRYYIERHLDAHAGDIAGRVLEVGSDQYTRSFGGGRVTVADVLHVDADDPNATVVGDLVTGLGLPAGAYDCFIITQTLQFLTDAHAAIRHMHAMLAPGGVVLATMTGIGQLSRYDMDRWGEYRRFTSLGAHRLFGEVFDLDDVAVTVFGNPRSAVALLYGIAADDLSVADLDRTDVDYEVIVAVRARKRGAEPLDGRTKP